MTRRVFLALLCFTFPWIFGCEKLSSQDRTQFTLFANVITKADSVSLLEGLPQDFKPGDKTPNGQTPLQINRSFFNSQTVALQPGHVKALRSLLASSDTYYSSEPLKCIFHPDFAVSFKNGDETCHVLLCFTCSEVLFVLNEGLFVSRLRKASHNQLVASLQPYRNAQYGPLRAIK